MAEIHQWLVLAVSASLRGNWKQNKTAVKLAERVIMEISVANLSTFSTQAQRDRPDEEIKQKIR